MPWSVAIGTGRPETGREEVEEGPTRPLGFHHDRIFFGGFALTHLGLMEKGHMQSKMLSDLGTLAFLPG